MSGLVERLEYRIQFAGGTVDTTFGENGSATFDYVHALGGGTWSLGDQGFTQDALGRIYGYATASQGDSQRLLVIARMTRDGIIDTTFAENGYRLLGRNPTTQNRPDHLHVTVDALNRTHILDGSIFWRLTPGGKMDRTVGATRGKASIPVLTTYEDIATDSAGRAYVAGTSAGKTGTRMTVLRFTETGSLDTTYGFGGAFKSPVPGKTGDKARSSNARLLRFVNDSLIVAGNYSYSRYDSEYPGYFGHKATWTVRLDAGGMVDTAYGRNGYAEHDYVDSDVAWGQANPTTIAPDGSIFGAVTGGTDYPDGDPASFGSNFQISADGKTAGSIKIATTDQDDAFDLESVTQPVAVESAGTVIAIGPQAKLYRSKLNNTIDGAFGIGGYSADRASRVQIAYDGTILYSDALTGATITRLWKNDLPVGQIDTKNLRIARTTATRFSIIWRDDDGMDVDSVRAGGVKVSGPFDGVSTTRTAAVESVEELEDGRVMAIYRLTSPGGWTSADNGLFSVRVLGGIIQDTHSVAVAAHTIGSFRVKIA